MTRYHLLLLVGVAACDPTEAIEPASEQLPPAEPGIQLPFAAPQSDGMFPQIAWDSGSRDLFLPDRPNAAPTELVRFDVDDGTRTTVETLETGLQVLASGGGSVFYTQSMSREDVLSRVGGSEVRPVTAVQFAVSRNGKWIVVRESGWVAIELATGRRRPVPTIPDGRFPLAIDSAGSQVAFGLVGPLSEYDPDVTVADLDLGTTKSIPTPGDRLLAVEFVGDRPLLLAFSVNDSANTSSLTFTTRSDLLNSTRTVGVVPVMNRDVFVGACGSWSPDAGYGVGVVRVGNPKGARARHAIVKLDGEAQARVVGTADLWDPTDCTLSPDGKWFVYGNGTGYVTPGELYLKPIR
jgi:hypothetical protein